jgi:hypothetical protein
MNAKSPKEINSLCETVGKYGGKIFEEMATPGGRGGRSSELINKAKQMDKGTGLLMLAAAEEAVLQFQRATKDHGLYARAVEANKSVVETAAYIRCHSMIVPKYTSGREVINSRTSSLPAKQETIYNQYEAFDFDGFNWKVLSVKRLPEIGRATDPQKPVNGTFVAVELQLKNISDKPRYYGSGILLGNNTQYPSSSKSHYLKEQMGYADNKYTQFQPGSVLKTYTVFDAGFSSEYILLHKEWSGDRQVKIRISR